MHWLDPDILPRVTGRVARYTLNRHGDVDGFLLDGDRQVHVPPHMGAAVARLVAIGDAVEARYVKPRGADVHAAVSVTAGGRTIVDDGPPHARGRPPAKTAKPRTKPAHVVGRVIATLHAPKGEVAGAVLDDGTQVRVDAKANADLADYFARGAAIEVWGETFARRGVTVVDVHEIAFAPA